MASIMPNPTTLSLATRLPPTHTRTFSRSRSPSRSPVRKAQFAARELDPLLQSLSPDATLDALQKTNTIAGNREEQTALAKSISDASESERELGIRAAVAAKNLKQWSTEVSFWSWPSREDRAWGAGFIPPTNNGDGCTYYFGCLPKPVAKQYEDRLDEIWDAIETLGMDDLKDYVFSFHNPGTSSGSSRSYPSSYGRMRDFTALVTAIVIQSLPVQANLLILLDTWSIRLSVLREIPDLLSRFDQVKQALNEIRQIIQDPKVSRRLTKSELDTAKVIFGNKVSHLGKRVDALLDQLEGQEDSLPQAWLDTLDDIEHKYAGWVVEAEQVVLRNQMSKDSPSIGFGNEGSTAVADSVFAHPTPLTLPQDPSITTKPTESTAPVSTIAELPAEVVVVKRKPLQETNLKVHQKHQRGFSEVSAADSTFSGYSLENAEIVDAVETKVMPSPRISVIDHQSSPNKASLPWIKGGINTGLSPPRPGMPLQRASTASIEVIPKSRIKEVMLRRSASHDLLSAQNKPSRSASYTDVAPPERNPMVPSSLLEVGTLTPLATSPSPSLRVDPLNMRGKELAPSPFDEPPRLPRRSSKRLSMPLLEHYQRSTTPPNAEPAETERAVMDDYVQPVLSATEPKKEQTFDDRLKSILASMPTRIRLTAGSDSGRASDSSSESSTRASSPVQTLRLSPVKDTKSNRYQSTSGIRVYNLSKKGQSRDAPPIKLFVRAVGEHGERVMVRVGGGWADLAEYLREYSLHHGGRGLTERRLEVAGYPRGDSKKHSGGSTTGSPSGRGSPNPRPMSTINPTETNFDFGLGHGSVTRSIKPQVSVTSLDSSSQQHIPVRPPPIPIIPTAKSSSAQTRGSDPRDQVTTRSPTPSSVSRPGSRVSVHTSVSPGVTITTGPVNNYTPLGGAGPVQNNRRATSNTFAQSPSNEAWVNGMMNQARAVSGSHAQYSHTQNTQNANPMNRNSVTVSSPTTTTTTTITSARSRTPNPAKMNKRASAVITPVISVSTGPTTPENTTNTRPIAYSSPIGSETSKLSSGSSGSYATTNTNTSKLKKSDSDGRRKSMMGLGDVSGIRRVFLRKKSDK